MNIKALKIVGIATSVVGVVASLVGNYVGEKQRDNKIAEEVAKAVAKLPEKKS